MEFIKNNWDKIFTFVWGSLFTASGIYMVVTFINENSELSSWKQFFELLIGINIGVGITYLGLKTQKKMYKEWKDNK